MNKSIYLILLILFKIILNGIPVAELKIEEETESECYNTVEPKNIDDCKDKDIDEEDKYCCFFEIETLRKEKKKRCAGLTEFQYNHIKLYVKEKMDQLLYRDLKINCKSNLINMNMNILLISFSFILLLI